MLLEHSYQEDPADQEVKSYTEEETKSFTFIIVHQVQLPKILVYLVNLVLAP